MGNLAKRYTGATVALHWRYDGLTVQRTPSGHQMDTECSGFGRPNLSDNGFRTRLGPRTDRWTSTQAVRQGSKVADPAQPDDIFGSDTGPVGAQPRNDTLRAALLRSCSAAEDQGSRGKQQKTHHNQA